MSTPSRQDFDHSTRGTLAHGVGAFAGVMLATVGLFQGIAILYDQDWARVTDVVIVVLSAVANFAFLPYYPFWSMTVIAIDILTIWALSSLIRNT